MKRLLLLVLLLAPAACFEFDDPVIPERRAPAILQANMRVLEGGTFQIDGSLTPGREQTGALRIVQVPQIHASEFVAEPVDRDDRGVHMYFSTFTISAERAAGAFELVPPAVRGTTAVPPVVWYGLRRVGADTLRLPAGADIVVRVDTVPQPSQPAQRTRQWFAEVRGAGTVFRLSADGAPPAALRIPADWVGGNAGGQAVVSLIYYQSAQLRTAGNTYIANVLLDTRMSWTVLFDEPVP
jgi:hypothetical protein